MSRDRLMILTYVPVPACSGAARRRAALATLLALFGSLAPLSMVPAARAQDAAELASQVEIRRTAYGIPHIRAENLRAAGFAMGYAQSEDYGERVVLGLVRARGEMARHTDRAALDADFANRRTWRRAVETYPLLEPDTRDMLEGFAAGVNRYVELHPGEFPAWVRPDFTGYDVAATGITAASQSSIQRAAARIEGRRQESRPDLSDPDRLEEGSNAFALAPSRTTSGHAILMRNPHLAWTAGYYEAHLVVPGKLDFYGDFRVGGPLGIIGGFNRHLGWSTTNNAVDLEEVYALDSDPAHPDHYLFDGASLPIRRETQTVEFRNGDGLAMETREHLTTHLGPVVLRADGRIYVIRVGGEGEFRGGEQFLRMMKATSLDEWKDAMRLRARTSSNFTYADRAGNIFYIWNATIPDRPHPAGGGAPVAARRTADVWTRTVEFERLPQLLNPPGGYVRNENDAPYWTNLHAVMDPADFPPYFEADRLRLRSQHGLELVHNDRRFSLEDVVRVKHSYRMLLAERVKADLLSAVRAAGPPSPEVARAVEVLERWDDTVAPESRGGVLFDVWYRRYRSMLNGAEEFRHPWTRAEPTTTPRGLANPALAAEAFARAVEETRGRYGAVDVPWGEVHRVRRGDVDVPVGGCSGALGCYRVLNFEEAPDGKRVVTGGDGWVLAVEFGEVPRAYSVLAYGQSAREGSPHHADQAAMFARGEMKPVPFTEADIERATVRRYRPGVREEPVRRRR
jgi:acyl-homoserine-lactone acylase